MSGAHAQESATSPGDTVVELESLSAEGFAATVDAGNIEQEGDGSLTIENEHGEHIGALDTQITLGDGETRTIEYEVSGGSFEATYNSPNTDAQVENFVLDPSEASEGENGAQVQSRSVECGLSVWVAPGSRSTRYAGRGFFNGYRFQHTQPGCGTRALSGAGWCCIPSSNP